MLDITLALIFSQLPHPECWMPRSHWRLSIAFGLLLPAWCSPGSCVMECGAGVCLQMLFLFMFICHWPLAAEIPVHCEVCVTLWSFLFVLCWITTVLSVQFCPPPLVAQTLLIFSTQIYWNTNAVCPEQSGWIFFVSLLLFSSHFSL